MNTDNGPQITVDDLLTLRGADREAKAYAFLYAAFKRTEVSSNPVRDALDCLVPFISPFANENAGRQLTAMGVRDYLKERIGFDLPLYAVEQIFSALQKHGYAEYNKITRAYIAKEHHSNFHVAKRDIESDYDGIARSLEAHAKQVGFDVPPPSGGWGEALIDFLRRRGDKAASKVTSVKSVLMDPMKAQEVVVAGYIRKLSEAEPERFASLIRVFMGALIEDFISSVSEVGAIGKGKPVDVFYDTAVILRQLGCSGKTFKVATEELTQYLHDIGCNIYFFSRNELEVANIIDTILFVKDTGKEVEGETAEALALGEITTTDLRVLQNTVPERLARDNIFPANELERVASSAERHQIDEKGFSEFLLRQSLSAGRAYGVQNRINDASYLGNVMRIRRGTRSRDFASCSAVFVTSNRFLASSSRKYLIEQKAISGTDCPPILSVGQIATIAWLMKDHSISEEKAERELLLNCYAAVSPDADWFRNFREGIEKLVGPVDEFGKDGKNALALQAARRIAGEESFGHSLVVRELNMAEILSRAKEEAEKERARWKSEQDVQLAEAEDRHKQSVDEAVRERMRIISEAEQARREAVERAVKDADASVRAEIERNRSTKAQRRADAAVLAIKVALLIIVAAAVLTSLLQGSSVYWAITAVLAVVTVLGFADLLRLPYLSAIVEILRSRLYALFLRL